jgi:hypothetical protein
MATITGAWAILSNPDRRAAYDAEVVKVHNRRATDRAVPTAPVAQAPNIGRMAPTRPGTGTIIDFGRYVGWSIGSLIDHDPDYLEWLKRTPIGRRLAPEIEAAMASRASERSAAIPSFRPLKRRRSFGKPWASAPVASR